MKAVVVLSPSYNYLEANARVASQESRLLGIDVITMINLIPFFEANPDEAIGERKLLEATTEIAEYLTHEDNVTLKGAVLFSKVGNIDWSWMQRRETSLRASRIVYEARTRVMRMT